MLNKKGDGQMHVPTYGYVSGGYFLLRTLAWVFLQVLIVLLEEVEQKARRAGVPMHMEAPIRDYPPNDSRLELMYKTGMSYYCIALKFAAFLNGWVVLGPLFKKQINSAIACAGQYDPVHYPARQAVADICSGHAGATLAFYDGDPYKMQRVLHTMPTYVAALKSVKLFWFF